MIELNIPGRGIFQIEYLVCDVNGTLALDGKLLPGVTSLIRKIQDRLKVYLITADTHAKQYLIDSELELQAKIIQKGQEASQKSEFINQLGAEKVIAIGQGANDSEMLKTAAIGICVLSEEGTALESMLSADIVVKDELSALRLVYNPLRIVATLRR
ncbi:MAG: HAD family hydrolase [Anaerolineaceae bacterium]|nr:HAD family hydrolase [Anaerolineaceae bacterium]